MNPDPNVDEPKLDLSAKGIWQQLPAESQKAYGAFTQYLELGPDATLQELADKTGKSLPAIWNFSSRYQWASRAAAWRQHFAAINCDAMEKATKKMADLWAMRQQVLREQNWETFQKLSIWCLQSVNKAMSNPQKDVAPYEIRGLLQLASKLGQQATSFETNPTEERDIDSDPIVLEFRANLQKVCEDEIKAEEELAPQSPPAVVAPTATALPRGQTAPVETAQPTNGNGAATSHAAPMNEAKRVEPGGNPSKIEAVPPSPSAPAPLAAPSPKILEPAASSSPALKTEPPAINRPDPQPAAAIPRLGHNGKPIDPSHTWRGPLKPGLVVANAAQTKIDPVPDSAAAPADHAPASSPPADSRPQPLKFPHATFQFNLDNPVSPDGSCGSSM